MSISAFFDQIFQLWIQNRLICVDFFKFYIKINQKAFQSGSFSKKFPMSPSAFFDKICQLWIKNAIISVNFNKNIDKKHPNQVQDQPRPRALRALIHLIILDFILKIKNKTNLNCYPIQIVSQYFMRKHI